MIEKGSDTTESMSQKHNFHDMVLYIYLTIDLNNLFPLSRIESFILYKINYESKAVVTNCVLQDDVAFKWNYKHWRCHKRYKWQWKLSSIVEILYFSFTHKMYIGRPKRTINQRYVCIWVFVIVKSSYLYSPYHLVFIRLLPNSHQRILKAEARIRICSPTSLSNYILLKGTKQIFNSYLPHILFGFQRLLIL